jgi:SagB-type dehydrogenase family enzyme
MARRYVVSEYAAQLLSAFATPRTIDEMKQAIDEWIAAGILVDADAPTPAAARHWDPASLAFHSSSRDRTFRKTPGHRTSAVAPRRSNATIPLAPFRGDRAADLPSLLDARRSRRAWSNVPMPLQTFSDLLWLSARNRDDPQRTTSVSRPYPSGGAAYSLELYPILGENAVETLDSGAYHYLPDAHALELVSPFTPDYQPFLVGAGRAMGATPPPIAIVITSRYARQSEEYNRKAYSLVLKEVGCLFQTLYLVAEALGVAACALGGGTPHGVLAALCHTTELEEPVVGEFALGMPAG